MPSLIILKYRCPMKILSIVGTLILDVGIFLGYLDTQATFAKTVSIRGNLHTRIHRSSNIAFQGSTMNVKDYGAVGDGKTDDTVAINAAAVKAAKNHVYLFFPPGTFIISSYINIFNGVRGVIGQGGIIKISDGSHSQSGIKLAGKADAQKQNVSNCRIEGLKIDMNRDQTGSVGIFGGNISNCRITNNHVYNIATGYGILVRSLEQGLEPATNNIISNNLVEGDTSQNAPEYFGIGLDTMINLNGYPGQDVKWKSTFVTGKGYYPPKNNQIRGNTVIGGYYGINISSARNNSIVGNTVSDNMRNISCQNDCSSNRIIGNTLKQSISSSIHLAYGSSYNLIFGNKITTSRGIGEGLLQAYVGSKYNKFRGNTVNSSGTGSKYHIYTAVQSDGNEFSNNTLIGSCSRAYIGVESAWKENNNLASRAYQIGKVTDLFTRHGMRKIIINNNTIKGTSTVPAIFIGQWSDAKGAYPLQDLDISGNTITSNKHNYQIELYEDTPNNLRSVRLTNNKFAPNSPRARFKFSRNRLHFSRCVGNSSLRTCN
jgi:parallel beta-helix repeat protein